jgi:CheY-like chemotaxis protein
MAAPHHILAIVQSDLPLICTLRRTLESHGYPGFSVARNSQEAILYLRGIVLDSHNPDCIDLDVLAWIRDHPVFAELPLLILCSGTDASHQVSCMLDSGSFLVDRNNLSELFDALRTIDQIQSSLNL